MNIKRRTRMLIGAAAASAAIGSAAIATAATASAGPLAITFYEDLMTHGITFHDARLAEVEAQQVCYQLLHQGKNATDAENYISREYNYLTRDQAAYFVVAASNTYCPGARG